LTPKEIQQTIQNGLHIHCPDGSTPKDGPSAGAAITTTIYSLFNNLKIKRNIAITGEITLTGNITAIGGLDLKIIGGIKTLNNITKTTKLSSIESVGGKASELVRRAGYYGTLGGVTDVIASVPEQDRTAAEVFGLTETPEDIRNLEGSERAVETLKRKLKFGAEGAIIGGAIPLLPAVGTLGYKYGLSYPIKGASKVLGPVLNATNEIVLNPLSKLIAGEESKNIIPKFS
jgi:hypothetical protein